MPKKKIISKSVSDSDSDRIPSYHGKNASDISDEEVLSDETISKKAKESFVKNEFLEKIIKYIKIDDLIRQETSEYREKINTLKEEKNEMESFILRYLDHVEENVVNVQGAGKLTKQESIRKGGLNKDIIKDSIYEQLKKEKLVTDEKIGKELAENTFNLMEEKREKKSKIYLKRTMERKKKEKKKKKTGEK